MLDVKVIKAPAPGTMQIIRQRSGARWGEDFRPAAVYAVPSSGRQDSGVCGMPVMRSDIAIPAMQWLHPALI